MVISMKTDNPIKTAAGQALQACLAKVSFLKVERFSRESGDPGLRPDFLVHLKQAGKKLRLAVKVEANGQPRFAREAVNRLRRFQDAHPGTYGIFMAPFISRQAAEICRHGHIGYADLAGNCRLAFGPVYIEQSGRANAFSRQRDLKSLYSPKAARVLRSLLRFPRRDWKMLELAADAGVSLGQAANVKKLLADREWIAVGPGGFRLAEPVKLLEEWADNYTYRKHRAFYARTARSPLESQTRLADWARTRGVEYALTGPGAAAWWLGRAEEEPTLPLRDLPGRIPELLMAFVSRQGEEAAAQLGVAALRGQANVILMLPADDGVFAGSRLKDGLMLASPLQIYLDAAGISGGRAAEEIKKRELMPGW